jgi:bifunctional DNA-binding transcriptional regulator/antitoxin component of YhaV-PrlF toxin-antitoxin module
MLCYGATMSTTVGQFTTASARLRPKHQLTLPQAVADALDLAPGDRLIFCLDGTSGVTVRKARESYAGAFPGMWGKTDAEVNEYIRGERDSWER